MKTKIISLLVLTIAGCAFNTSINYGEDWTYFDRQRTTGKTEYILKSKGHSRLGNRSKKENYDDKKSFVGDGIGFFADARCL